MRLSFGLEHRQLQVQKLAPRMIQSMEILQLPVAGAAGADRAGAGRESRAGAARARSRRCPTSRTSATTRREKTIDDKPLVVDEAHNNADDFERLLNLDREVPEYFDETTRRSASRIEEDSERAHDVIANVADRPESLQDYLMHQLGELELDARAAGRCASGSSARSIPRTAATSAPACAICCRPTPRPSSSQLAEKALALVQSLDPPGIAARDLRECLLAAARRRTWLFYEELKTLITNHLEDLARQPPAADPEGDRLFDRRRSRRPGTSCASSIPSRAPSSPKRSCPRSRPTCTVERDRRRPLQSASSKTAARRRCTSASTIASGWPAARRRRKSGNTSSGRSTPPSG